MENQEKQYKCPVCSEVYTTLSGLRECISYHEKDEENAQEQKREQEIQAIRKENDSLVEVLRENCKKLEQLGYVTYLRYDTHKKNDVKIRKPRNIYNELFGIF